MVDAVRLVLNPPPPQGSIHASDTGEYPLTASSINARPRTAVGGAFARAIRAHTGIYPEIGNSQLQIDGGLGDERHVSGYCVADPGVHPCHALRVIQLPGRTTCKRERVRLACTVPPRRVCERLAFRGLTLFSFIARAQSSVSVPVGFP